MVEPVWGADTIVSMPVPLKKAQQELVDMGGFTITQHGLAHSITESDVEDYISPTFRPMVAPEAL